MGTTQILWSGPDAAYRGKAVETLLQDAGDESRIQEKGQRVTHSLMQHNRGIENAPRPAPGWSMSLRQLWIRTPGLGDNISVGTPLLEISSPTQDATKNTFSPTGRNCWFLWCTQESCSAPKGSAQLESCPICYEPLSIIRICLWANHQQHARQADTLYWLGSGHVLVVLTQSHLQLHQVCATQLWTGEYNLRASNPHLLIPQSLGTATPGQPHRPATQNLLFPNGQAFSQDAESG